MLGQVAEDEAVHPVSSGGIERLAIDASGGVDEVESGGVLDKVAIPLLRAILRPRAAATEVVAIFEFVLAGAADV